MTERFQIGIIIKAHGVRGEVKVYPTTDDPGRFKKLKNVIVRKGEKEEVLPVVSARFFKDTVILKLGGIEDCDRAETYRKAELLVERADAVPLKENEYYTADLIDMTVQDENGTVLGVLTEVLSTGANDVYVVEREGGKELLIPAIRDCILKVDVEQDLMTVHLLEGLTTL